MDTRETHPAPTSVVITFPTEDAAERFIYLVQQLGELRGSALMRLLPISAALKRYVELATDIFKTADR